MKYSFLAFFALMASVACQSGGSEKKSGASGNTVDTVAAFVLQETSLAKNIELPAELLPYEQAELFARVQGYIKEIRVDLGDRVRRGQVLAMIEAPELNTKYAEYQSSLQAARSKYLSSADMYQRLQKASQANTPGIVAPVDLVRSRNQYLADSASYQAARHLSQSYGQVADLLVLKAPFDGIITARNADRGSLVGNNQSIVTVQNNNQLRLRIAVPETFVATGDSGKEASFRVDAYPEKLFTATLSRKGGSIDPVNRTEKWEYAFVNTNHELKSGSFAYVKLNMHRTGNSFIVPPTAIATTQERKFVIQVKDGKAEWVDVRQGLSTEKGIEIFGDIHNGDTLLQRATDERKPGNTAYWKVVR